MMRWPRRVLAVSLSALLLLGTSEVAADASAVPRISRVATVAQKSSCASGLKVHWHRVRGASYEVRWARSKAGLGQATPVAVGRTRTVLPVTGKSFVQVRAVRGGRTGAWSRPSVGRVGAGSRVSSKLAKPALSGFGLPGGVQFTWGCTSGAVRYRVQWAAAPHGYWPKTTNYATGWLPQAARSATYAVSATPHAGDYMLNVAYANPVWGRLVAGNKRGGKRLSVGWTPVFPAAPDPGPGDPLRIGTYNVMLSPGPGARVNAIAANIAEHGLTVVALQEASATTASAVKAALGAGWEAVPPASLSTQQILYRSDRYAVRQYGTFNLTNWKDGAHPVVTPWATLSPKSSISPGHGRDFSVASVHFTLNDAASALEKKRQNGQSAQELARSMAPLAQAGPVVLAGDLFNQREPFGDTPGYVEAQPTLVRSGYYDAMAAQQKTNIAYATYNGAGGARQAPADSGVSSRTDYLMLSGFRGSNAYVNVANWSLNGLVPSDHNLVYADLTVPFAP